ncbi:hypothetical protein YC2023_095089 [Brassica napus]
MTLASLAASRRMVLAKSSNLIDLDHLPQNFPHRSNPKTLSKPGVANMAKERATKDVISDEKCKDMKEQRDKKRQNKINKPWNNPRAMKDSIKVRSPNQILKTKTIRDYRRQTSDEQNNIYDK